MSRSRTILLLAAGALLSACSPMMGSVYSEPYVLFVAEHRKQLQNVIPAVIMKIDGQEAAGRKDPVKPGMHTLELAVTGVADRKTLRVDAKPCMRYYIGARRPAPGAAEIVPFVSEEERIGECKT